MTTDDQNPEVPAEVPEESTDSPEATEATGEFADSVETAEVGDVEPAEVIAEGDGDELIGAETPASGAGDGAMGGAQESVEPPASTVDFHELVDALPGSDPQSLSVLFDLSMPVAIELGRTRMSVQDVLSLGRGSVVQLDRLAGEPVDVFVGDRRFAEGEVVVLGEQFGVRITRIIAGAIPATAAVAT